MITFGAVLGAISKDSANAVYCLSKHKTDKTNQSFVKPVLAHHYLLFCFVYAICARNYNLHAEIVLVLNRSVTTQLQIFLNELQRTL